VTPCEAARTSNETDVGKHGEKRTANKSLYLENDRKATVTIED